MQERNNLNMNKNKIEQEIPKYLKQKESNISKSNRKSKHKHQYEECLIQYKRNLKSNAFTQEEKERIHISLRSYCVICGKIGSRFDENKSIVKNYRKTVNTSIGKCYSLITSEELYKKYHNKMPIFFVEDIFKEKYVDLEQNDE